MRKLLQPFLLQLAKATDRELASMVEYLKAETRILRDELPKRLSVSLQERQWVLKLSAKTDAAIKDLITIVTPRTFAQCLAGE